MSKKLTLLEIRQLAQLSNNVRDLYELFKEYEEDLESVVKDLKYGGRKTPKDKIENAEKIIDKAPEPVRSLSNKMDLILNHLLERAYDNNCNDVIRNDDLVISGLYNSTN